MLMRIPALLLFLAAAPLLAQPAGNPDLQTVEVIALSRVELPALFYRAPDNSFAPLPVGRESRGKPFDWTPGPSFAVYREVENEAGEKLIEALFETPVPQGEGDLLIFLFHTKEGNLSSTAILSEDGRAHRPLSARMINLTKTEIGCVIGDQRQRLQPSADLVVPVGVSAEERFRFGFQFLDFDQMPVRSPIRTLRFFNGQTRLTLVFSYRENVEENSQGQLNRTMEPHAFRIYDVIAPDQT